MREVIEKAADAAARAEIWWLFSRLYLERPEASFVHQFAHSLRREQGNQTAPDSQLAALMDFLNQDAAELADILLLEYTRLLRGIQKGYGPPPPYESIHRGESVLGNTCLAVTRCYREAGFEGIFPGAGPQDHIGVELRFLAFLSLRESEALTAGDAASVRRHRKAQQHFLVQHMSEWVPAYCERLIAESRTPYYAAVAQMTIRLLEAAREELDIPDEESAADVVFSPANTASA